MGKVSDGGCDREAWDHNTRTLFLPQVLCVDAQRTKLFTIRHEEWYNYLHMVIIKMLQFSIYYVCLPLLDVFIVTFACFLGVFSKICIKRKKKKKVSKQLFKIHQFHFITVVVFS